MPDIGKDLLWNGENSRKWGRYFLFEKGTEKNELYP